MYEAKEKIIRFVEEFRDAAKVYECNISVWSLTDHCLKDYKDRELLKIKNEGMYFLNIDWKIL